MVDALRPQEVALDVLGCQVADLDRAKLANEAGQYGPVVDLGVGCQVKPSVQVLGEDFGDWRGRPCTGGTPLNGAPYRKIAESTLRRSMGYFTI